MTTDDPQIDDIDIDNDSEDLDSGHAPERAGLKEIWDSNPLLKIGALIGGIVVVGFLYLSFVGPDEENAPKAIVSGGAGSTIKVIPGQEEVDEEYRQAIEKQNKMNAENAMKTGVSAMPTPIGTSQAEGVTVPEPPPVTQEDPLNEWRARTEAKRVLQESSPAAQEEEMMRPEVVPMVQPVRPQAAMKMDPNAINMLASQMRVIVTAQAPEASKAATVTNEDNEYTKLQKQRAAEKAAQAAGGGLAPGAAGAGAPGMPATAPAAAMKPKILIQAGSIGYAQLLNDLNSDIKGPALAQMLSGPLQGGRALGDYTMQDEYLVLKFTRIVKDGVTYTVDGIALDEKTTLAAQQSDVDHHYLQRILLPAAAAFVEGYGQAVSETGTSTTTTSGGGVASDTPEPDAKEELFKGIEKASGKISSIIDQGANRPITVTLNRGTTMGILFMEPVTTASAK